jgi:uncharacterized oligopeptide transporter (OPT) family protein
MATVEALTQVYGHGREAAQRLAALFGAAALAALVKWIDEFQAALPRWAPGPRLERLTFTVDPSLLLLGFGAIVGVRVGLSLLLGAVLAWGLLAPWLLARGLVEVPAASRGPQFAVLVEWLLWPGVSLMVCATLSSLALRAWRHRAVRRPAREPSGARRAERLPAIGLCAAAALVVALQVTLFGIDPAMALLTIPLAVCLAAVAARVVGATGIPPIGAIGQLSQMGFGVVAPGQVPLNLMSANTAGGAAGQCTDLMNDFKVGKLIGATPSRQALAQCVGIVVGSIVGVLVYQALIPDPRSMLLTAEWPAPAVATWAAVARTLDAGLDAVSASIRWAIVLGGGAGLALGVLDALLPARRARRLPSAAALGLAFVLPASASMTMALGAILAWTVGRVRPGAGERLTVAVAAGLIAGESMAGVGASFWRLARGG